jgi:uncharacterized protein (DUF58 family)
MASRFDPSELKRYGGLALIARQVVEGFLTGVHRSPYKGASIEFAEHRAYTQGDDIRHVDWRVFGKTDRYFIKEFEDETNLRAWLILDASGSMAYRGQQSENSKFDVAARLAAALAFLLLRQADAVGLVTHDSQIRQVLPPKAQPRQLLRLAQMLQDITPGADTGLAPVWDDVARRFLRRRSLVVCLTDAFDRMEALRSALLRLRHGRHEVIFLQVVAAEELEFPFHKPTRFSSLESDVEQTIQPRSFREQYLKRLEAHQMELQKTTANLRMGFLQVRTDEPIERALGAFLRLRERQSGGSR